MSEMNEKKIHKTFDITSEIDNHISKRFEIKKRLGKGAYGIVWKAVDRKTKETVAIKKIFDAFRNQTDAQRTFREIVFLQSFRNHPNIIKLHSIHRASNNRDIYLGFEYMQTDLHNVIKRGDILKDIHKKYIMYQILKATKYIHSGNVIHRDQKPSNVLIDNSCRVKIADFGLARSVSSCTNGPGDVDPCLTDYVATRWYRAPEILIASRSYTKGIDMWSLGCILAEMILGKPLFPGTSTMNQVEMIMSSITPPTERDIMAVCNTYGSCLIRNSVSNRTPLKDILRSGPTQGVDLACSLLVFNPALRLTAEQALQHIYVAEFHQEKNEPSMGRNIVPPLCDDQRLSVDEYRNRLYALMKKSPSRHTPVDENSIRPSSELPNPKFFTKNTTKPVQQGYNPSKMKPSDKNYCTLSNTVYQYAQKLHQPTSTSQSDSIPDINKNTAIIANNPEKKKPNPKIPPETNSTVKVIKRNPLIKYFSTEEYYSNKNQKHDELKTKGKGGITRSLSEDTYMNSVNGKKKPINYGSFNCISKISADKYPKTSLSKYEHKCNNMYDSKPRVL